MIIDLLHNKIVASTITEGFTRSVENNLVPKLLELYGESLVGIQMYEDYISDELVKDGYWYYPLSVNIGGVNAVVWIKWDISDKSKFEGGVCYSYVGDGDIDFIIADDVPIAFGRVIENRKIHYEGGTIKVNVTTDAPGATVLAGKYSQTFVDVLSRQMTGAIERACGVAGIADSSIELHLFFGPSTYMEHTSENVTYRRLLISAKNCAPRDFWVKWTRLDSATAFSVCDTVCDDNIRFEIGEDVSHKIREKEYRFLVYGNSDKYRVAMGRKNITEWRELIKRSIKRGELQKTTSELELENHSTELSDKLSEILEKCGVTIPDVPASDEPIGADIANEALRLAVLGDLAKDSSYDAERDASEALENAESPELTETETETAKAEAEALEAEETAKVETKALESEETAKAEAKALEAEETAEAEAEALETEETAEAEAEALEAEEAAEAKENADVENEADEAAAEVSDSEDEPALLTEDGEPEFQLEITLEDGDDVSVADVAENCEEFDLGLGTDAPSVSDEKDDGELFEEEPKQITFEIDELDNDSRSEQRTAMEELFAIMKPETESRDRIDIVKNFEAAEEVSELDSSDDALPALDDGEKDDISAPKASASASYEEDFCSGDSDEDEDEDEDDDDEISALLSRAGAEIERMQTQIDEATLNLARERELHKKTLAYLEFERASLEESKQNEAKLIASLEESRDIAAEEINARKLAEAEADRLRAELENIMNEKRALAAELECARAAEAELSDKLRAAERELLEQTELYEKDKRRDKQLFAVAARQASEERRRAAEAMEAYERDDEPFDTAGEDDIAAERKDAPELSAPSAEADHAKDEHTWSSVERAEASSEENSGELVNTDSNDDVADIKTPEELAEERRLKALEWAKEMRLRMEAEARAEAESIASVREEYKPRFTEIDEDGSIVCDTATAMPKSSVSFEEIEDAELPENEFAPSDSEPAESVVYTSKLVRILFRNTVDPSITVKLREMITEALVKFNKETVYMQIKASIQDSTTVVLNFVKIPENENNLLIDIIHYLGNASIGIYKIILE